MTDRVAVPLSVIMPAHNEAAHIEATAAEWYDAVITRIEGSELVVVDDCSTDDTGRRLARLAADKRHLRVLTTPANGGHGRAVRFGLDRCLGEYVFQTDSDRQYDPEDFWRLWDHRHGYDFVFGVRQHRADGAFRELISRALRAANALLWRRWVTDANCPFKLMRASALKAVLGEVPRDTFIPMVMVSILAWHRGFAVTEVPVRHFARTAGQQSLKGLVKWTRVCFRCLGELLVLRLGIGRGARRVVRRETP